MKFEIFSKNDLAVMLHLCGYHKICGIDLDGIVIKDNVMLNVVNNLIKRRIMTTFDDKFVIMDYYREMIDIIGEADKFLIVKNRYLKDECLCCYVGKRILVCDLMPVSDDKLGLALIEKEEFQYIIDEYKGLDSEKDIFINSEELYDFDKMMIQPCISNNFTMESPIVFSLEMYNNKGSRLAALLLIEHYLFYYIYYSKGDNEMRYPYDYDKLYELLDILVGG
ncbi:MAG: hypothetical protein MSH11_06145 [Ruminococcus sp.]|nr:hypothetical protein [Ruminococcus sp.]